jgi:hypothetical protein
LLVDHQEYKDQLRWYEEADGAIGMEPAMHGAAVASIAVGKTVGVAPDADLYFFATYFCNTTGGYADNDFACLAKSVDRVLAVNAQLPTGRKIRVISISVGWDSTSKGYKEITDAVNAAKAAGMLVICSSVEDIHGFKFNALGREPLSDPDQFTSYEPGIFWANTFYDPTGKTADFFANRLMVPMDSRTTASPTGVDEYVFYREGGWSWSIPYIAGMFALAVQVKPAITPDEFWNLGLQSGQTIQLSHAGKAIPFGPILDPAKLIEKLQG